MNISGLSNATGWAFGSAAISSLISVVYYMIEIKKAKISIYNDSPLYIDILLREEVII